MNGIKKRGAVLFALAAALSVFAFGAVRSDAATATADGADGNVGRTYYYDELENSELAQKFYGAFDEMTKSGGFKSGNFDYDLTPLVTEAELSAYLDNGKPTIPVAFGAARDAYTMDHPELFYVDMYKMYVTAGSKGGKDFISAGTGNADNYYADNTFKTAAEVEAAVTAFDKAVDAAVAAANASGADTVAQIRNVNKYIAENTAYDYNYGAVKASDGSVTYDGHVYTAYGALVNKKAVCGGIARAFKVVMDRLGIPCVLVQGAVNSGIVASNSKDGYAPHMWNAVEADGMWYCVDVTYNLGNDANINKYTLVGDSSLTDRFEDGVVSSSGFKLEYPALRPLDYGVDGDLSGFNFKDSGTLVVDGKDTEFGYSTFESDGKERTALVLGVSYKGKDARELKKEGKYLSYRFVYKEGGESAWSSYTEESTAYGFDTAGYGEGYTVYTYYESMYKVEYAVIDCLPDMGIGDGHKYLYNPETFDDSHIISKSVAYANKAHDYVIPPYVKKTVPNNTGYIKSFDPLDIELTYNEKLVASDGSEAGENYAVELVVRDSGGKVIENRVADVKWHPEDNRLTFRFTPIMSYARDCEMFNFTPVNLKSAKSGLVPEPGGDIGFKFKSVVCPKVFNDGRLYMQVFGEPQFVSAADESENGFKDADGKPIAGKQRSQLMLVVNSPSKAESDDMKDAAKSQLGLTDNDIKASATYQIDLHLCGVVQTVPAGSFMQVGFGFPEGYGPEHAGVTFTCYHYTKNPDGTVKDVQEVPCVITEYGLVATVKSFSPFMICAVDSSKAGKTKSVYASVDGVGGSVENAEIRQVNEGESVTFKLVKQSGYDYDKVLLNGTDVKSKITADGTLTLSYAELTGTTVGGKKYGNSNVLEASFISDRVAKYNGDNGIVVKTPKIVVTEADMIKAKPHAAFASGSDPVPPKSNTGLVVGIIVGIMIVLTGAGVAVYFIFRNKNKTAAAKASAGKADKASAPKKSEEKPADPKPAAKPIVKRDDAELIRSGTARPATTTKPTSASPRPASTGARPAGTTSARPSTGTRPTGTTSSRPSTGTRPTGTTSSRPSSSARPPVNKDNKK